MHVTFYGAVREVTGSLHLMGTGDDNILLDCGLFQGRRKETAEKNRVFPFDPAVATNIILSHAHIDHSGRIPLMTRSNFNGRVICTRATAGACHYLLPDSAHIQESDAQYLNYKTVRGALSQIRTGKNHKKIGNREKNEIKKLLKTNRHRLNADVIDELIHKHHLQGVEPLYTAQDAEQALSCMDGVPYRNPLQVGKNLTNTFYEAGHILGSAISMITHEANGQLRTICYTGDIGRFDKPILKDPAKNFAKEHLDVDLMIMESTYGDRLHEPVIDLRPKLKETLLDTLDRGGSILIPSFAFGRTQELLYVLHELYDNNEVPRIPIYVDSPLATNLTAVFGEHPEVYDQETHAAFLQKGKNPFLFDQVNFTKSVEESMALMKEKKPHIVISASGMCEAGRILHHLRYKIHNPNNTILIVGYMANHTLGRRILEQGLAYEKRGRAGAPPMIRFLNKEYPLKAHVVKLGGFSAHGDKHEMLRFLKESDLRVKKIAVVHGEENQSVAFGSFLNENGFDAVVPRVGETFLV
ncbi:MAG: MBL fold metallo-hydrolase [Deltaproteobacteria bacterium]|nr:MBL fold metallo-hydrolase [Deltaproteobacteria bacterium]